MADDNFLVAQSVGVAMQGRWILKDISLSLRPEEFFVIMGPNGSGKTILLKILAGLMAPTEGDVTIATSAGQVQMSRAIEQRKVQTAFIFEQGGLIGNLSIRENIALPLCYGTGVPPDRLDQVVQNVLVQYGLEECAGLRPANLSAGLSKRVQIARAEVMRPEAVFYDNPELGLDADQNSLLRESIVALHKEGGRLSVVATGAANWELEAANRIALLNQGRLEAVGSLRELKSHPLGRVRQLFHASTQSTP